MSGSRADYEQRRQSGERGGCAGASGSSGGETGRSHVGLRKVGHSGQKIETPPKTGLTTAWCSGEPRETRDATKQSLSRAVPCPEAPCPAAFP